MTPEAFPDVTDLSLGEAAYTYAVEGFHVFPVQAGDKEPISCPPCGLVNGFRAATTDRALVGRWWSHHPDANIGHVPGLAGLIGLDFDELAEYQAYRSEAKAHPGPTTATVVTGRGYHLYLGPGDDDPEVTSCYIPIGDHKVLVRGRGGYLLLPGSIHESGRKYTLVEMVKGATPNIAATPKWISELLKAPKQVEVAELPDARGISLADLPRSVTPRIMGLIADGAPKGKRSNADAAVVTALLAAGVDEASIAGVFERYRIGEKMREPGNGPRYLALTIATAKDKLPKGSEAQDRPADLLVPGGDFILDEPPISSLWGSEAIKEVLWSEGESVWLVGPPGVGKSTLAEILSLARIGIGDNHVLGHKVKRSDGTLLYLAADRPRQIARSFGRMITEEHRATLNERLKVWRGALPFTIVENPRALLEWAQSHDADTLIIDSVKDIASGLTKDEVASDVNAAFGAVVNAGIQLIALHHQRKGTVGNKKPKGLDDVFGSRWLTAGAGSVIMLWADHIAAPVIELTHLKTPAEPVGPIPITIDYWEGTMTPGADPLAVLKAMPGDFTVEDFACTWFDTNDLEPGQKEKARRKLENFERGGYCKKGPRPQSRGTPQLWSRVKPQSAMFDGSD